MQQFLAILLPSIRRNFLHLIQVYLVWQEMGLCMSQPHAKTVYHADFTSLFTVASRAGVNETIY